MLKTVVRIVAFNHETGKYKAHLQTNVALVAQKVKPIEILALFKVIQLR